MEIFRVLEISDTERQEDIPHLALFRENVIKALEYLTEARNEFEEIHWENPNDDTVQNTYGNIEELIVNLYGYKQSKPIPAQLLKSGQYCDERR